MEVEFQTAVQAAQVASKLLMKHFQRDLEVEYKSDKYDPVTQADRTADIILTHAIRNTFFRDTVISEEGSHNAKSFDGRVWLVDPLDGTKDYIAGRDTFSVLIGLMQDGVPQLGVVYMPARHELYAAIKGQGAFRLAKGERIPVHVAGVTRLRDARMSLRIPTLEKRPLDSVIDKLTVRERQYGGSIGSRLCDIANNKTDVFVNTNHRASKWDTLAGGLILSEAGGTMTDIHGRPLDYLQPGVQWPELFVAGASQELVAETVQSLAASASSSSNT